jgi:hypothetical protein
MPNYDQPSEDGNAPVRDAPFVALVCGGRDYADRDAVFVALDALHRKHGNITILHGACPTGADAFALEWAVLNERPFIGVPAQWSTHGASAGPIRNGRMLCYLPHGCVAFPGSAGTADMIRQAEAAGVRVWRP